jgi:DNA-binding PadR family transcriptional regulator
MSSLTGLSKRQVQVLWAVHEINQTQSHRGGASGGRIVTKFHGSALDPDVAEVTPQGIHQTASSLVKRGALTKLSLGRVCYRLTEHGKALLDREVEVLGRPL